MHHVERGGNDPLIFCFPLPPHAHRRAEVGLEVSSAGFRTESFGRRLRGKIVKCLAEKHTKVYSVNMINKLSGFQWDKGNKAKCQKHGVSLETVEGIFLTGVIILPDVGHSLNEKRYRAIGKDTDRRSKGGRIL